MTILCRLHRARPCAEPSPVRITAKRRFLSGISGCTSAAVCRKRCRICSVRGWLNESNQHEILSNVGVKSACRINIRGDSTPALPAGIAIPAPCARVFKCLRAEDTHRPVRRSSMIISERERFPSRTASGSRMIVSSSKSLFPDSNEASISFTRPRIVSDSHGFCKVPIMRIGRCPNPPLFSKSGQKL